MLYHNYNGLTYRWNYAHTVVVLDGKRVVDSFSVGGFDSDEVSHSDFIDGVVSWDKYMFEAQYYNAEV